MYKIIFMLIILIQITGYAQCNTDNTQEMKQFNNSKQIENFTLDKRFNSSNVPGNAHYKNGNNLLRIVTAAGRISVRNSFEDTPYQTLEIYNEKTKLLIEEGEIFSSLNYGIWKKYDDKGHLVEEINYDKYYKFSIDDLIKKMREEHDVDILDKYRISTSRIYNETLNQSFYTLTVRPFQGSEQFTSYIVDGNTGETILQKSMKTGDKNLYNTYIETIKNLE